MNHQKNRRNFAQFYYLILVILYLSGHQALATDSNYLQELNSEADEVATFEADESSLVNTDDALALEQRKELEAALKDQLSNTYTIYRKLTTQQKILVVESYLASGKKISVASRQIFNFYFNETSR